ncbi:hypothetical protein SAMN05216274_10449 [Cryobacterium levicorallinum]|uniref:Uncharacterized protein n=1 Tax=Cryobacterium levicorallinum TaxID=995038 RepID=A0ABY1EBJ8_9MICO|nr:hypothetical protein SAMN05216274_10449 [Cryobacterium levicorallinum]
MKTNDLQHAGHQLDTRLRPMPSGRDSPPVQHRCVVDLSPDEVPK